MAIGRLPVLSPAELAGVVAKIQAYESLGGSWVDQALFIADNVDGGSNFAAESDQLESALTGDFDVAKVYLDAQTPAAAHDAVVAAFEAGTNYVQYVGHGGLDRFADESVLTNADVAGLINGGRAPVVAALTCAVNRFELPDYPALGEELVRSATGGATAVFAPSGLGQHGAAREFASRLAAALFRPETPRLGDALVARRTVVRRCRRQRGSVADLQPARRRRAALASADRAAGGAGPAVGRVTGQVLATSAVKAPGDPDAGPRRSRQGG